jgi:hypothetical protein
MLGMNPSRQSPPLNGQSEDDFKRRQADAEAREKARQRVQALDIRVDVLTRRIDRHERKPSHR